MDRTLHAYSFTMTPGGIVLGKERDEHHALDGTTYSMGPDGDWFRITKSGRKHRAGKRERADLRRIRARHLLGPSPLLRAAMTPTVAAS